MLIETKRRQLKL